MLFDLWVVFSFMSLIMKNFKRIFINCFIMSYIIIYFIIIISDLLDKVENSIIFKIIKLISTQLWIDWLLMLKYDFCLFKSI